MSKINQTLAVLLALALLASSSANVSAQNAGAAAVSNLTRANSAANFTVQQIQRQNISQSIPVTGVAGVNRRNYAPSYLNDLSQKQKPFSRIDRAPAVSPYLALSNPFSTASDYYNIVKPQQQQERINRQIAQQQYVQQRRLNQVAAQGPYSVTGNEDLAPTGHAATYMHFGSFMNTGNFFAPPTRSKQDR
ncbi:hypothetical protein [Bythopirellula polymerisocia]|uniref:Uncharacterized protein n=1 Tax=Bythopirellula polymerisocia TaxID=2528003 RepID=A0A5C6D4B6_9BACT|nr:hypothetical protein [Bythopirellula polymerisocia]TWU29689.1 hypothetical protein Pla144_04680 [Bythopirellula polymerisocia]